MKNKIIKFTRSIITKTGIEDVQYYGRIHIEDKKEIIGGISEDLLETLSGEYSWLQLELEEVRGVKEIKEEDISKFLIGRYGILEREKEHCEKTYKGIIIISVCLSIPLLICFILLR
jgi:hypothetical protein